MNKRKMKEKHIKKPKEYDQQQKGRQKNMK